MPFHKIIRDVLFCIRKIMQDIAAFEGCNIRS